jgi:ATP-dependent Lhr-like helicase
METPDCLVLKWAHPLVAEWFISRFGTPTEPQIEGWPPILAGKTTLISAPTGSGKTLAAFLACIDKLVRKAVEGKLRDTTEVLYVSPLKALSNDIQKNLEQPLREITQLAAERGVQMAEIRAAVRTGDTLAPERRKMIARPPHILVTTPESLYILLTAEKSIATLRNIQTVIVDEIHAVADDKRGAHLSLSLERLSSITGSEPVRIGLSATQKPIEVVAQFLAGSKSAPPVIVNVGPRRKLDLAVVVPGSPLGPVCANEMWDEMYDRLAELSREHRSTLVFVNTRRLSERVAHHLAERLGEEFVAAHHGSLSRKIRLSAERRLKAGELRVLVATASLELGIDIGTIDLVCQIGSPRSIAAGLQRVGRAGHWRGAVPKGRIFATTLDELIECAALVSAVRQGDLDSVIVPEAPLDILAQQIVATCSTADWPEDDLYNLVTRAYPYRNLERAEFDAILTMLAEGFAGRNVRFGAYLHRDLVNRRVKARRGSKLAAITSGGAIPENALFTVVAEPEQTVVGTLDEDFAVESNRGDIILLGNTSWQIHRVEGSAGRVIVHDAHGAPPSVPFWRGEAPARSEELSARVADLRERISSRLANTTVESLQAKGAEVEQAVAQLKEECGLDQAGAEQAIDYIVQGRTVLGTVPTLSTIVAERFFDEGGGMQLIIHAPFGGRITKAWGLALRKRFCRSFNFELQAAATDNGLCISLSEQHSFPLADVFHFLHANSVEPVLEQAALQSPIFTTRWRWDANRALSVLRFRGGKKVPPQIQRMRAEDLLAVIFPQAAACQDNIEGEIEIPDHPLVKEVMKDVLSEALDLEGLKKVLNGITTGEIRCVAVDTPVPSAFSHEILNANPYAYLDDAPLEERRARAVEMRRVLPASVLEEVGRLDQNALASVCEEAWPDVRDEDELHDAMLTLIAIPEATVNGNTGYANLATRNHTSPLPTWQRFAGNLVESRRAGVAIADGIKLWFAAERRAAFNAVYPQASIISCPAQVPQPASPEEASSTLLKGWLMHAGPLTATELSQALALPQADVELALLKLEGSGAIMRGRFSDKHDGAVEWCERRLLARIHKLTLGILRREIEPVTAAQFFRWLTHWQHVAPGTQLAGDHGLFAILRQLQGFEVPANAWENQVLANRMRLYDSDKLDKLCLTGLVGWGRLSPHPAFSGGAVSGQEGTVPASRKETIRRVIPTSVAPVTFFAREEADWMMPRHMDQELEGSALSHTAQTVLRFLTQRGASFFADIVRASGHLKSEVETALWELVTAGLVTADGFDNLRALIDPARRSGQGRGRTARPRHSTGRWSLLYTEAAADRAQTLEAICRLLLRRYGVVFRDLLAREEIVTTWRELLLTYRRLEDRGEVRGGRFISGFLGEQFALPHAVDGLRAARKKENTGETITISAADPLNLVGILLPGDKIPAVSGRYITFKDGIFQGVGDVPRRAHLAP